MSHATETTQFDVAVVGSCMQDLTSYCERFPRPGETVRGHSFQMSFGGKGANQAVGAAKLGARVAFVGRVGGADTFGPKIIENMIAWGIDVGNLKLNSDDVTGTANIYVDAHAENCIVIVPGANLALSVGDVRAAEQSYIRQCRVLVAQLEIDPQATLEALRLARANHVTTILNPAPASNLPQALNDQLCSLADILCPNEHEAALLVGTAPTDNAAGEIEPLLDALLAKGCRIAVVTQGSKGCVFKRNGDLKLQHVHAPKVAHAVDTTGAGDCFIGALAFYCATAPNLALEEKLRRACVIAAHSVQFKGTQTSFPLRAQLDSSLFTD